ncbi:MAG TPA: insulinase family protein, partial [Vicinamibacterales bacterium]|nr:insulinase family protein [Vicinamibacterales bacterium]
FLGAGAYGGELGTSLDTFNFGASVQEGRIAEGLGALALEAKRVREHGFGPGEFDRAKKWMLAFYERAYTERDKTESSSFAREYVQLFLTGEPSPGIAYEYKLVQEVLPSITLAEVTAAAHALLNTPSRVILATSPEKKDLAVPDRAALEAALAAAEKAAVTPWPDKASTTTLMETPPDPGTVIEKRALPKLDVTIVRFANGVDAWLKPTDFKNDQVLFSLTAPGGSSVAPPERYVEASFASSLVQLSGAGGHSAVELQRLIAGKLAGASPSVTLSTHGISGSATPAQLETGLQLLHLNFVAPGNDDEAFAYLTKQLEEAVMNRDRNPSAVFGERLGQVNTSGHYTSRPLTLERVRALDRKTMMTFYEEAFSNAANFTFFMVGAFKMDEALPLLSRYVGSLPSKSGAPQSKYKDVGIEFPKEIKKEVVEKGREPRSQTVISFFADPPPDEVEQSRVSAATEVLEIVLRDIIREELGQTYGVSVGHVQPLPQRGAGRVAISFTASPENVNALIDRVLKEVARLQQEGPNADLTTRAKEAARREHEISLKQNGYWLARLQSAHLLGRDPEAILTRVQRIEALTPQVLQGAFKQYFPLDRYTVVTLMPEKPAAGGEGPAASVGVSRVSAAGGLHRRR